MTQVKKNTAPTKKEMVAMILANGGKANMSMTRDAVKAIFLATPVAPVNVAPAQDYITDEEAQALLAVTPVNAARSAHVAVDPSLPTDKDAPATQNKQPKGEVNTMTNNQPASITMTEVQLQARIDAALKQQENALMALFQTKLAEVAAAQQPAPVAPAPVVEAPAVDPVVDLEKQDDVLKAEFQALGFAMVNAKTDADRKALAAKLSAVTNTRASIQSKIAHLTGAGLRGAADLTRSGINLSDMARKGLIAVVNGTFDGVNYVLNGTANVLDKAADYIDPEGARVEVIQPKTLPTLA